MSRSIGGRDEVFYRRWREVVALSREAILDGEADVAAVLGEVAAWCAISWRFYRLADFVRRDFA